MAGKWVRDVLGKISPSDGASNGPGFGGSGMRARGVGPGPKIAGVLSRQFLSGQNWCSDAL